MALPSPDKLKTMDYVYRGSPFVSVIARETVSLSSMDNVYMGEPFVEVPAKDTIDLTSMDVTYMGSPFVPVLAKDTFTLLGMDYIYMGEPFVANPVTEGADINPKVYISGAFYTKLINVIVDSSFVTKTMKVKVGAAWQ